MQRNLDPISFELIKNSVEAIADEMTLVVLRTAHSGNIRDGMDFSAAICTADGEMVAQGLCIALHLGSIPDAIATVIGKFGANVRPDDVFILNDPYCGGMHLPDIFVFKPVFAEGALLGYLVIVADHADIGGRVPGGRSVDATEIYQEGLRIPPLRLMDAGNPVDAVWEMIAQNVRIPKTVIADLQSCLAACHAGEERLKETVQRFGRERVRDFFHDTLSYSEDVARSTIREIPDGRYDFVDHLDDSVTAEEPVVIKVSITVAGDRLLADFAGSSPEVPASINSTLSFTKSAVYAAIRTLMPQDTPNNSGLFRPITVTAPRGSVVCAEEPAPVASRGVTGFRVVDAVFGALAKAIPSRVGAASEGGASSLRIGGRDDSDRPFVLFDSMQGTWGARPDADGLDGCSNFAANAANVPVEVIEGQFPIRIHEYGLRADTGGSGRWRGGLGLRREWELMCSEAVLTMRADRTKFAPWGLEGGQPGALAKNILHTPSETRVLPSKLHYRLHKGDRFVHEQAAGGGYGDPLERDPDAVLVDWLDEKVTTRHAFDAYAVVIDERARSVDMEATRTLRLSVRGLVRDD
ncbi:MAG TPA: hydantoinase B/oxoprolinase family protein [Candidatus Saccharimonadales bacterium]|nr:hydantoinase B/oxoprolinase family protein [Candidatus Saccharimonadales bacterium]